MSCSVGLRTVEAPPNPWAHLYFKAVATVGGRRYFSIYDGTTEYVPGVTIRQEVQPRHGGGFYVFRTMEEAVCVDVPAGSRLRVASPCPPSDTYHVSPFHLNCVQSARVQDHPRAVVKLWGWGDLCIYDSGKLAERAPGLSSAVMSVYECAKSAGCMLLSPHPLVYWCMVYGPPSVARVYPAY
jgi:hypothetical protein